MTRMHDRLYSTPSLLVPVKSLKYSATLLFLPEDQTLIRWKWSDILIRQFVAVLKRRVPEVFSSLSSPLLRSSNALY
jgi:hypothetical protein